MVNSILTDTKQALGVSEDATEFDLDIKMHVNTALFQLMQLGVGPADGCSIIDKDDGWDILLRGRTDLEAAKSYVFVVVRLAFDRPETSYGIQALQAMRDEWAWRLELQSRKGTNV